MKHAISKGLVCLLLLFTVARAQLESVSTHLTTDTRNFKSEVRSQPGYNASLHLFKISYNGDPKEDNFLLEVIILKNLLDEGSFYCLQGYFTAPSALEFIESPVKANLMTWTVEGSASRLTEALDCLRFGRLAHSLKESVHYLEYKLLNTTNKASVSFFQKLELPSKLRYEMLPASSTVIIAPGRSFRASLVSVKESEEVIQGTLVRSRQTENEREYFSLQIKEGVVFVEGFAPNKAPLGTDSLGIRVDFTLFDEASARETDSYTFYLQLDSIKITRKEQLQLIVLTLLICTIILFLFVCVFIVLRREKQQQQQQVQDAIQEAVPDENILTKSILEWNKEATSTRDQTHKDSVLHNPYDKYSLKKRDTNQSSAHGSSGRSMNLYSNLSKDSGLAKTDRDIKNVSQLEFSKLDELNANTDRRPKEIEFGDLSKIADNRGPGGDDEANSPGTQHDQNTANTNLQLEDIILKEL